MTLKILSSNVPNTVPLVDLRVQYEAIAPEIDDAVARIVRGATSCSALRSKPSRRNSPRTAGPATQSA